MARKYRRHNPSMRGPLDEAGYEAAAAEYAAQSQSAYAAEQQRQAAQERSMAEYAARQEARQYESDRQASYERSQREFARQQELGRQDAIAAAWRAAQSDAIATKRGQMVSQAIAGLGKPQSAGLYSPGRVVVQSVTAGPKTPSNVPKVGAGMKGRKRNGDFDWIPDWVPGTEGLRIETQQRSAPQQYYAAPNAGGGYVAAEASLRPYQRQQELAQQQAIAQAWNRAAGNAQAQRQGQAARQSVAASAQQRTAGYASAPTFSAQRGPSVQRAPQNLPKVGGGMKGRKRNPAALTNDDFHSVNIGGNLCVVCGYPAIDRSGKGKYLVAIFHDGGEFEVQTVTGPALKSMLPSLSELRLPRGYETAFRRFKQQCEQVVRDRGPLALARSSNPGHEGGFWDAHGGDAAYGDRHAILKKALKGEWKPVSRAEVLREVRDKRGHVDDNRVRRLLSAYRAKVDSLADRCMRAEHSGQPFPVLEAKYEAAQLDLEDVQALVQELTEGRTRNPRVHHGADYDDLVGGRVVMRPVRAGSKAKRSREDIVAELLAIGGKRERASARAHSERSRSRVR